jgi:glucose/arabinose dehydrogenase
MELRATPTSRETLRSLPTPARPIVDASDVEVPEGYEVEPVLVGLSFPTGMGFAPDGTLFVLEGGATWPTRPGLIPRILRLDPGGNLEVFATETFGGPRGVVYRDGAIYVSLKGGYKSRVVRYDVATRERAVLIDQLPQGGWHEPGGPVFSPRDGLMYFGQGSVSLNGVVEPTGFSVDVAKHPNAHDVPGQDVKLTGNNVWTYNPTTSYPYYAETGAFKPYGVPARKGEVVKGELWCNTCIMRSQPDGTEPELLAWGVRNPWGMTFSEDGELYVADLCMEEKGARPVGEDPGRIWHIKNATEPHGSVGTPDWYGFPDYCGDGLPVWHEKHRAEVGPITGQHPEPLIEDPPPLAGPAVFLNEPHTGNGKIEFCASDDFGYRGRLFLCQFGTYYPLNTMREDRATNGFNVVAIDLENPEEPEVFMRNRQPGPVSAHPGSGGIERPVDVKFHPDGQSMYVLDFGLHAITNKYIWAYGHTGVLWRVTRQG